jgi:hypothetical protein|tara:strand:+ start:778 stop:1074 length:297 start_codon:yes stop_codon:yes gene_type:complete
VPRKIQTPPTAGWQSCDASPGPHVGRFVIVGLEFELEQLEIETGLDAIENIDKIEKSTKIVWQPQPSMAKIRMCHHLQDLQQHRYCGTRQLAVVELMS